MSESQGDAAGLRATVEALETQVHDLRARKDGAYKERNLLVAALSKLFPASLERHPEDDLEWEDDWRWVVFIQLPEGQATWHIHDSHLAFFDHLPRYEGRVWDEHTTEEKYRRLAMLRPGYCVKPVMANGEDHLD